MRKYVNKAKSVLVDTTCVALGVVHFTTQTVADVSMHLESKLKQRSTGELLEDIKKERMVVTIERQQMIINRYEQALDRVSKAKAIVKERANSTRKTVSSFVDKKSMALVPAEHYEMQPSLTIKS